MTSFVKTVSFYSSSGEDSLAVIRMYGPAKQLGLKVIKGVDEGIVHTNLIPESDLIVIQRDFCRDLELYEQIRDLALAHKKPVVFDLDDLLFELPEDHPDRLSGVFSDSLLPMLQAVMEADLVTVATPALRDYLLPYNSDIVVVPNYLNDNLWQFKDPALPSSSSEKVTIGYMGGHSHKPDIQLVIPALERINAKYPKKVCFHFWGIEPPVELEPYSRLDWCPPKSFEYVDFVSYFQTQTADIMIAPLCDTLFNSCKSPIKFFDYGVLGVPGIYSRVTPYANMIEDGVDGLLASSTDEWEHALSTLIESKELRRTIALNAQKKIKQHWLLSQNAHQLLRLYENAIEQYDPQKRHYPHFYSTIKSLARQLFNELRHRNHQLEENRNTNLSLQNAFSTLRETLEESNNKVNKLQYSLEEKQAQISSMQFKLEENDNAISVLRDDLENKRNTILALENTLENREKTISELKGQMKDNWDTISLLRDKLDANKITIAAFQKSLEEQANAIAVLHENLEVHYNRIQRLNAKVSELENEVLVYALSKSWRLTRPFRRIYKRLKRGMR